jgi:hypothetical protein
MVRSLYIWLIGLHPFCFRQRFAEEMLTFFDAAAGPRAVGTLFADALISVLRQRLFRSEFRESSLAPARQPGAPAFCLIDSYKPRPTALIHGAMLSVAVLCAVVLAIGYGGVHRPAFMIGVRHPGTGLFPTDRAAFTETAHATQVKFGPEPEDPWRPIASFYFKIIRPLDALDVDHNLTISAWEIITAPAVLQRLDTNHDGKLSPEECGFVLAADSEIELDPQFVKRARLAFMRSNPVLATLDANHDGEISAIEIQKSSVTLRKLDRNGDGSLTPNELLPDAVASQAALILSRLDSNSNGSISAKERASKEAEPIRALLEGADRNHDGVTTERELINELRFREELRKEFDNAMAAGRLGADSHR